MTKEDLIKEIIQMLLESDIVTVLALRDVIKDMTGIPQKRRFYEFVREL